MALWITLTKDSLNPILNMKKLIGILVLSLLWSNTVSAKSLKVIDGDTIILNGEKIRFSGIDTPELKQTCLKDNEEVGCGMFAKMLLVKKIGNKLFLGFLQDNFQAGVNPFEGYSQYFQISDFPGFELIGDPNGCLLYTSPSPRDS